MAKNIVKGITVEIGGDTTELDKALQGTDKELSTITKDLKHVEKLLKMDPTNIVLLSQKEGLLAEQTEKLTDRENKLKEALNSVTVNDEAFEKWKKAQASIQGQITKTANEIGNLEKEAKKLEAQGLAPDSKELVEVRKKISALTEESTRLNKSLTDTYDELGRPVSSKTFDAMQREYIETTIAADDARKASESFSPALARVGAVADEVAEKAGKVADATKGLSLAAGGALTALGVSFRDAEGFRDVEYVFNDVLMAMSQIPNETERDIMAMTLFGRSADQLAGIIDDGGEVLRQLGQEAEEAGLILSQDALDSANKFNDQLDELKAKGGAAFLEIGMTLAEAFLPGLENAVDAVVPLLERIAQLDTGTIQFIVTVLALVAAISPVAGAIASVASAVSTLTKNWDTLKKGISAVWTLFGSNPMLVAIGAIIAAIALLILNWDKVKETVENVINAVVGFIEKAISAVKRFFSALNDGGGNAGGSPSGGSGLRQAYTSRASLLDDYPHFASGGVFAPNSPMLGVLGDNKSEYEVAAPESVIEDSVLNAMSKSGLGGVQNVKVYVQFTGNLAQIGRVLQPVITAETARLGPSLG